MRMTSKKQQNQKYDMRNGGKTWVDRRKGNATNKKNNKACIQELTIKDMERS